MKDLTTKCLFDVQDACRAILSFTEGKRFEEFSRDDLIRSAVERKFEVIGEALRRIRDEDPDIFKQIEMGNEIVGMRNRLIHGYDAVDEEIVWETIDMHLPQLLQTVEALLR
ncbi:MAG: DUF86 domain-containing protein [Verrucomicrobia bacterium]|nr:DUF86 domain-containing protein [Verrucomicrobiota bacterium]